MDERSWFACHTRSRHEKSVERRLTRCGIEAYLPLIPRVSEWHDREKTILWPLFPGYVFARFGGADANTVQSTPGVVSIVSSGGKTLAVSSEEIANVRRLEKAIITTGKFPSREPAIKAGIQVDVIRGPFTGIYGRVVEHRGQRVMLHVGLWALGQQVCLELDRGSIEVISDRRRGS